jgi:beta-xylosidase
MWSEGDWGNSTYGVSYAKSTSPTGPFTPAGKILSTDPAIANGPGHHSVVHIPNIDDWYIVYHRHPLDTEDRNQRVMAIDRMRFDNTGNIETIRMTMDCPGVNPIKHYAYTRALRRRSSKWPNARPDTMAR